MWPTEDKTEELLLGAKAGDDDAINRLIERHRGAVLRMVQMRLDQKIRRRVDVSDVVQDVMIDASRRLQDYIANPAMPFHLWLRHIAKDRIIDAHRRHRGSQKRSVDREQGLAVPGADDHSTMDLAAHLCDGELTPPPQRRNARWPSGSKRQSQNSASKTARSSSCGTTNSFQTRKFPKHLD